MSDFVNVTGLISSILNIDSSILKNIKLLKKGMTNRSFYFEIEDEKYIIRTPGEGTQELIDRQNEANIYSVIKDYNISDEIIYIDEISGIKIARFYKNARVCNANSYEDICLCMKKLRDFHNKKIVTAIRFDIFEQINFYEKLWGGNKSVYSDYDSVKKKVFRLKEFINTLSLQECLTHIDANPDNFLFLENNDIKIIDWEYAAMQDPHVDIAMFCIYSMYNKSEIDKLIDIYFEGKYDDDVKIKIYCYISMCGLLWSNWCEYKRLLGIEFGEYALKQYEYAKEYFDIVNEKLRLV